MEKRQGLMFWMLFCLCLPWQLVRVSQASKPERLVAFNPFYALALWPAKVILRKKLILFVRLSLRAARTWIESVINQLGLRSADTIVCMTEVMKSEVEGVLGLSHRKVIAVLPNELTSQTQTVALNQEMPLQCIAAGYLVKRKNIGMLLDTFAILQKKLGAQSPHLRIVGDGPELSALRAYAVKLQLGNIEFIGWQEDLTPLLLSSQVLLHPALYEGSPNIVLEALARGLAVLASDIPELRELLKSDSLLFNPHQAQRLAEQLEQLAFSAYNRMQNQALGRAAAEALRFNWEPKATELVELN